MAWLVLALFLIVALIQIAMHFDRLNNRAIAQLLVIPITIAAVVGLVCWLVGRAIFYRNTIAGTVGWSAVLLLATVMRILVMAGVFTGSMRGGNLRINTPGTAASNAPSTTPETPRPNRPVPVMPNPTPPMPPTPHPPAATNPAAPSAPSTATHDFATVAEQIANDSPAAREVLTRHARELQSLVDGFAVPARSFLAILDQPATVDTSTLRQRIAAAQSVKDASTRYSTAAKSLRERLETDLRALPDLDKNAIPSISGRFLGRTFATGRGFAMDRVARVADDLTKQSQLVLDAPSSWSIDANGRVNSTDVRKANEYRLFEAKLMGPKQMLKADVDRAIAP